MNNSAIID